MAENKELKYNVPWILQRADPFVCKKDGWYYFTASIPSYDCIALRRSKTLDGLKDAEEVVVWKKHEDLGDLFGAAVQLRRQVREHSGQIGRAHV